MSEETEKPKYLYRGIVIDYNKLEDFKFYGIDLTVPYEPIIDSQGRKVVPDGNEYGVYMTDNENMADNAYGNPNKNSNGSYINRTLKFGTNLPMGIMLAPIGIVYKINTEGMDVHKPWITGHLKGHYNNGYGGNEWITDRVPSNNYEIEKIIVGEDTLHDSQNIPIKDLDKGIVELKKIMEERKQRLEVFSNEMEKISEAKRIGFTIKEMELFKDIFGEKGVRYVDEESLNIVSSNDAIKYLLAKVYKENTDNIDLEKLKYIEELKIKLIKTDEPENINSIKEIILKDIEEIEQKKQNFIQRKQEEKQIPNTKNFDSKISKMEDILNKLEERQKQDSKESTEETIEKTTIDEPIMKNNNKTKEEETEENVSKRKTTKKYKTEDLEKMTAKDLMQTYRNARNSVKKHILKSLANNRKFAILMHDMTPQELVQMAKIHPYKEVVVDTMIHEMESHGTQMSKYFVGNHFQKTNFDKFMNTLQHKSFIDRVKETFSKNPALPEALPKKIEKVKKLCEIEVRRNNATGKKMEKLETKGLDQLSDESRVEIYNGEMAKVFDKYARKVYEKEKISAKYIKETDLKKELKKELTEIYTSILGTEKSDIAKLVTNAEFENYSGEMLYVPYRGNFAAKPYDIKDEDYRISSTYNRGWVKNLLEVEKVEDFTVQDKNLGEVFITKSEFMPTAYAIKGKWVPIYEYYIKKENGEFTRIGSGKVNEKTGKMETTISTDGKDISQDIRKGEFGKKAIDKGKEDGTILQFDSNEYTGISTKTSRKEIEQAITSKAIQKYVGKEKKIVDITQIKDIPVEEISGKSIIKKNAYMIACVENGIESYEMVCIGEDGKCETYPGMTQDIFAKKDMFFPTGMSTGYDKKTSLDVIDKKQALQTFKSRDGTQYSAYRDDNGNLRVAQLMEHVNGTGKYAEELDTYTVMHGDIEKMKAESKEEYDRTLNLLKAKETNQNTTLFTETSVR